MGQGPSKSEQRDVERDGSRTTVAAGGLPAQPSIADSKRRASGLRSTNRAIEHGDVLGLDESQSRSTESTQGSPEIGMFPCKPTPKGRKGPSGNSAGHRWFRRPSIAGGTHNKETLKNDPLPPSYLVFKQPEPRHHKSLPATLNGKTAPVPVTRKSQSLMTNMGSHSDGGVGDPEARADELERMYDMRTWDMYLRITEARKSRPVKATATATTSTMISHHQPQQQQQQHFHMPIRAQDDYDYFTPGDDSFLESSIPVDVSQSEELIFGDLE